MSFADIVGHDRPVTILKRALGNSMLAHAYLFSGEAGIGKKMTALALAAAVNCDTPGPEGGCGKCPSCRKTASFGHPDLHLVAADEGDIKIDQIRTVQADLALRPFEGRKKFLIVDGAEAMNPAAANAFLKTLEEPPGDALIILVSSMPQSLLQTIRSRCQEIKFFPLPRRVLAQALERRRGLSESDAWFIATLAQGSLGRALEMDVEAELKARDEALALWLTAGALGPVEALAKAEAVSKDREGFEQLLDRGVEWLRDALVYHATGDDGLVIHTRHVGQLRQWGERFSVTRMLADMDLFTQSRDLLDRRVSAQLVAENLLLKLGRG